MKNVKIADLKARLSEHLRYVRRGQTITVLDRDTPIAQIVPVHPSGLRIREPVQPGGLKSVQLPPPSSIEVDVVKLLREDRDKR